MSVCLFSADELGQFVATATHLQLGKFPDLVRLAEMVSSGNAAAYADTYGEFTAPESADDIERAALNLLARRQFVGHFGPLAYNCVSNNGKAFIGGASSDTAPAEEIGRVLDGVRAIETKCREHADAESRRLARQAEDDAAFADVGPLPTMTRDELTAEMDRRGASAVIVAECRVDQSDSQSDYFGHRNARTVVIGFRTGTRESFKQLRAAAGEFPPTADLGPGCNEYTALVVHENDVPSHRIYRGTASHWHDDIGHGKQFLRLADAEAFIASAPAPQRSFCGPDRELATFKWEIRTESVEHRENYSMGGGNYLGHGRHGGWIVRSQTYLPESVEVFDPPKTVKPRQSRKASATVPEKSPATAPAPLADYVANV